MASDKILLVGALAHLLHFLLFYKVEIDLVE